MGIKYEPASDIMKEVSELATLLFPHIKLDSLSCIRSFGSSSRGTIARCHALGKAMQLAMERKKGFYVIEILSRRFDKLSDEEKTKVLIHELMHIPKSFGGGFRHHDYVCERNIEREYQRYINMKQNMKQEKEFLKNFLEKKTVEEKEEEKELISEQDRKPEQNKTNESNININKTLERKKWFW